MARTRAYGSATASYDLQSGTWSLTATCVCKQKFRSRGTGTGAEQRARRPGPVSCSVGAAERGPVLLGDEPLELAAEARELERDVDQVRLLLAGQPGPHDPVDVGVAPP